MTNLNGEDMPFEGTPSADVDMSLSIILFGNEDKKKNMLSTSD